MIAAHICKPARYVNEAIALAEVPLEAKAMMQNGAVTPARVLQEVRTHGDKAVTVLREAVESAPEPAKTEGKAEAKAKPLARSKAPSSLERILALADKLAEAILDEDLTIGDAIKAAERYQAARGK